MLDEKEREALFILNRIPGMYHKRLKLMGEYAGSFCEALCISEEEYLKRGVFLRTKEKEYYEEYRRNETFLRESREAYKKLEESGIRMVDYTEKERIPVRLSAIPDPPVCFFTRGSLPDDNVPSASIIGSRRCSSYGREAAYFFGRELSKAGVQIVSGMAMGIDSYGLSGALSGSGQGFAVLGSGVDVCYPSSSRTIYEQMKSGKGGLLSEFAPDAAALGYHFVLRNRLISALGDVLIVIEAAERSGTAITVTDALEQGKDVFALPGRITDPLGRGCNKLLKDGAFPLTEPQDVLTYLGIDTQKSRKAPKAKSMAGLTDSEKAILLVLGPDPMHVEDIAALVKMEVKSVVSLLQSLELSGHVRQEENAYYSKVYH